MIRTEIKRNAYVRKNKKSKEEIHNNLVYRMSGDRNPAKRNDVRLKISEKAKMRSALTRGNIYKVSYNDGTGCFIRNLRLFCFDNNLSYEKALRNGYDHFKIEMV